MVQRTSVLVLAVFMVSSTVLAQELKIVPPESVGMSGKKLAKVDDAIAELMDESKIPGAVVIVAKNKQIVHFKAYGQRDLENRLPMQKDTIFRIYSMTKAITTAAAMMLVEDGKLDLDAPVAKYLPEVKDWPVAEADADAISARPMTVRDLIRHTSGLTYGGAGVDAHDQAYRELNLMDRDRSLAEFSKLLAELPLAFQPGTDWHYGISIDVLGRVVEVASGQSLDEFFTQRIFQPLAMSDTAFYVPEKKVDRFAANYTLADGELTLRDKVAESRYLKKPAFLSGGGGLVSTASDYMTFLLMLGNQGEWSGKRLLKAETVAEMVKNHVPESVGWIKFGKQVRTGVGFGLGFSVREKMSDWDPQGRVGEYGWGGAASTHYWSSPKDDLIIVTLEQVMPYSFATEFRVKGLIYDALTP